MNKLEALKAALEAKREAVRELRGPLPISDIAYFKREEEVFARQGEYERLLTDDTIASLIAVAEAAEREPDCPLCWAETHTAGRRAVPEPHLPDCPLALLVKEESDDRA